MLDWGRTYDSAVGLAAVGAAGAGTAEDGDGAEDAAEQAVAADLLRVVVGALGAGGAVGRGSSADGHGGGEDSEGLGELHFDLRGRKFDFEERSESV